MRRPGPRSIFGLLRVPELMDTEVVVRGWYRRSPAPVLELRDLVPEHGARVRGFQWVTSYAVSVVLTIAGAIAWTSLAG